jgi:acetyl esterase
MLITTGADVAEETRAFNQTLAETLAALPAHYEVNDPVASRAARARGEGPFPAPVLLDVGRERAIPGRAGQIPLRVFVPPVVRGVHLHIHGGGWTFGSASDQDPLLWRLAQAAEVAVVSVDYRLAPEHPYPAAPDDCEDAARWLVTKRPERVRHRPADGRRRIGRRAPGRGHPPASRRAGIPRGPAHVRGLRPVDDAQPAAVG